MRILTGQGIGDAVWSLFKIEDYVKRHGGGPIDLRVACSSSNFVEARALDHLRRFKFLNSVEMYRVHISKETHGAILLPGAQSTHEGYYRYIPDGPVGAKYPVALPDIDHVLIPNTALERGIHIDDWLPECKARWNIHDDLNIHDQEHEVATMLRKQHGEYIVFYPGPEAGNTHSGHNRGALWTPQQWIDLGDKLYDTYRRKIVVVGATYDATYFYKHLGPLLGNRDFWVNRIGELSINTTMAVVAQAKFVVSYQSGIGISAHYMGVPTAIFWRQFGDSISPRVHVSFEESMASAWGRPDYVNEGRLLPLFYGRANPEYVFNQITSRRWIDGPTSHKLADISEYFTTVKAVAEERIWATSHHKATRPMNAVITELGAKRVIELGCGSGWVPTTLARDIEYIGIDSNEVFLAMAKAKNSTREKAAFVHMDLRKATHEWMDSSADLAVCFACFKHFSLTEIDERLRGLMALGKNSFFDIQIAAYNFDNGTNFHNSYITQKRLERVVASAGHRIVKQTALSGKLKVTEGAFQEFHVLTAKK